MADTLVRKLGIFVDTNDATVGAEALHEAEAAVAKALDEISVRLGEEVVAVRRLDIPLIARRLDVGEALPTLESKLRSILDSTLFGDQVDGTSIVRYPSEAHALAAYLAALARGYGGDWPFCSFRHWGIDIESVVEHFCERGPLFIADTLAYLSRVAIPSELVPTPAAMRLLEVLDAVGMASGLVRIADLPQDVRTRLVEFVSSLPPTLNDTQARLDLMSVLYAEWPPVRGRAIEELTTSLLDGATEAQKWHALWDAIAATATPSSEPELGRSTRHPSRTSNDAVKRATVTVHAAGLLFWSLALQQLGADLDSLYPTRRVGGAVRWALGRVLQAASLSTRDPLLLLWSGEAIDASPGFSQVLQHATAEPLHAAAISIARRLGYLEESWRIMPLGAEQIAFGAGEIVLDTTRAEDVHAAVPHLVRNLRRRAPGVELILHVDNTLDSATLDSVSQVDAVFAPDGWCWALRTMASVLRRWLREEKRAELPTLYDWEATLVGQVIELRRVDVDRVDQGRWFEDPTVKLGEHRYSIRLS